MSNNDDATGERAQGDKPFLSIVKMVINEGDARPAQNQRCVCKVKTMLGNVATVLGHVPFELHPR